MSRMTLTQDQPMDMTLVSNCFIDHYMKDANDAQIKIYLYLLRLIGSGRDTCISDIADQFNHTEKDVLRAISYWEKKHLLEVSYNEAGEPCSLRFITPQNQETLAPVVSLVPSEPAAQPVKNTNTTAAKTGYSMDQLAALKKNSVFAQILSIAEVYLGRNLTATDVQSLAFIYNDLHFSFELMDYLIEYCVGKGKRRFSYIEEVARTWHTDGITTVAAAREFNYQYNRDVYTVMKALGRTSEPTKTEAEYVKRWYDTYAFDEDVILEACARCVKKVDRNRFEYTEGILSKWHKAGIHHMKDVEKADQEYAKVRVEKTQTSRKTKDSFNNFTQRSYDYDALEKELISN